MFGPDICGPGTKKVHVILNHKDKNHLINKEISCKDDEFTHVYTLVIKPDNTYEVLIDGEKKESGSLEEDWDILPPKKIKDPEAKKPEDWDDKETIPDPDDKKPEDWDKPEHIPDPEATKPEDWDDEMDGEWEPPMIDNPEYKGEWSPKQIDNPAYKGPWVHPEIDNPEYNPEPKLYAQKEICAIGLDLWQVKSGIKDPEAKKPEDWDDKETIPDPDDKKPEDWDKPEHIPDPEATKPEDWDDEMDGEWEPPMIDNPEYKGEWSPKQIDNPAY
nr:calreticulin [Cucujiformia]